MRPKRTSLLRTIRSAVDLLASQSDKPEVQSLLNVIDVCARELALREQPDFYLDYRARGTVLAARGRALLDERKIDTGSKLASVSLDPRSHPDVIGGAMTDVTAELERIVHALGPSAGAAVKSYFADVGAWEVSHYAHRTTQPEGAVLAPYDREKFNRERFEAYLKARSPSVPDLKLTEFRVIPGGFSKHTVTFDTEDSVNGRQSFVIRLEPPVKFMELDGMDIRREYPVVCYAYKHGVPVAEPMWIEEDQSLLGMRFFVSRKVPGEVFGTVKETNKPLPDDIMGKLARTIAGIHKVPIDRDDPLIQKSHLAKWLNYPTLAANTRGFVDYWANQAVINRMGPSPIITRALDWMKANVPPDDELFCLVHGDFGLHNVMIENGEVIAMLDWENSRIGDPAEEFARFFAGTHGKIDQDEFVELYREAGGKVFSPYRLRYFMIYDAISVAIACLCTLTRLDEFDRTNVNWSVFGLQFMHYYADRLEPLIEAAERARGK